MALTKVTGHVVLPTTNIEFHNTKSTGIVTFAHTSNATSTTTGALQVTGGVGIVKDLHVGGNITVGGTLTYDDVTNIDSLGIITARNNIHLQDYIYHRGEDPLNTYFGFPSNDTIDLATSGSPRIRIVSDGKIGINTTDVSHLLTVVAQSTSSTIARFKAFNKNSNFDIHTDASSHGQAYVRNNIGAIKVALNSNGDSYFTGGDVGIGTASPASKFHVDGGNITIRNGTAAGVILSEESGVGGSLKVTTATGNASFGPGNSTFCHVQTDRSGGFYFNKRAIVDEGIISSYDENLRIDAPINTPRIYIDKDNGRVGIGSDVPARPLSIGAGDGTVALHGGNAGIYIGTHPTGGFQNNCAIARSGATNYHIAGSTAGDLCIAGEAGQSMIFGLSHAAGAMHQAIHISRLRQFHFYYGSQDFRICTGDQSSNVPRVVVDSSGRVLLGTSSSRDTRAGGSAYSGQLQMESDIETALTMTRFGDTHPSRLNLQHARGTIASIAAAQENDDLGQISFSGWDGDTFSNAAEIRAEVDGPPGDDDMPGRLVFLTTGDNGYVPVERLRINSSGNLYAAGITTSANGFQFGSSSHYLYQSASDTVSLRVTSDGPYAQFKDVSGDLQMGSASGTLFLSAGGNEKLRILSDGNVRISDEHLRLDTTGKGIIFGIDGGSDRPSIIGNYTSSSNNNMVFNTAGVEKLKIDNSAVYVKSGFPLAFLASSGPTPNIKSSGTNNQDLIFTTGSGNPTRMQITSSGRIGIGTDTATAKLEISDAIGTTGEEVLLKLQGRATKNVYLDINADANRRGVIRFKSAGTDKWSIGRGDSDELNDSYFFIATGNSGGNTSKFVIKSDGDVMWNGISTQTPGHGNTTVGMGFEPRNGSIFLSRGNNATLFSNRNGDGPQLILKYNGSDKFHLGLDDSGATFRITSGAAGSPTSRFEIDSNGHTRATVRARTLVTSYKDAITNTGGCLTGGSNTEDAWIFNWYDSASWGIYSRNIDSTLTENGFGLPQNSTAFIGAGNLAAYISHESGEICGKGGFLIDGENTTTNQAKGIRWTAFDKENTNDRSDVAGIIHTINQEGIAGAVLRIYSDNDDNDGVVIKGGNLTSAYGTRVVNGLWVRSGGLRPTPGTGENGIKWANDPYNGSGDVAHIQYYADGSGENTRLRIEIANDADDDMELKAAGGVSVTGTFNVSSTKNFKIPHPLVGLTTTTDLVHTAVEGPQADNLYRGRTKLVAGISTVNIDTTNNMTEGTFVNLNRDVQCFTSNETGWTAVKGSVTGNLLTIVAQDNTCTDTISWMVVGERWDLAMYDPQNPLTDENGKLKTEVPNRNYNKDGGFEESYIYENRLRVGISTISRPSIENKEVE